MKWSKYTKTQNSKGIPHAHLSIDVPFCIIHTSQYVRAASAIATRQTYHPCQHTTQMSIPFTYNTENICCQNWLLSPLWWQCGYSLNACINFTKQDWHTSAVNHPGIRIRIILLSCLHKNTSWYDTLSHSITGKYTVTRTPEWLLPLLSRLRIIQHLSVFVC